MQTVGKSDGCYPAYSNEREKSDIVSINTRQKTERTKLLEKLPPACVPLSDVDHVGLSKGAEVRGARVGPNG